MKEQEGREVEEVGVAEADVGALLPPPVATWLGPGEGLLWLLWLTTEAHQKCVSLYLPQSRCSLGCFALHVNVSASFSQDFKRQT